MSFNANARHFNKQASNRFCFALNVKRSKAINISLAINYMRYVQCTHFRVDLKVPHR